MTAGFNTHRPNLIKPSELIAVMTNLARSAKAIGRASPRAESVKLSAQCVDTAARASA